MKSVYIINIFTILFFMFSCATSSSSTEKKKLITDPNKKAFVNLCLNMANMPDKDCSVFYELDFKNNPDKSQTIKVNACQNNYSIKLTRTPMGMGCMPDDVKILK